MSTLIFLAVADVAAARTDRQTPSSLTRARKYEICIFGRSRVREATQKCTERDVSSAVVESPPKVDFDESSLFFAF